MSLTIDDFKVGQTWENANGRTFTILAVVRGVVNPIISLVEDGDEALGYTLNEIVSYDWKLVKPKRTITLYRYTYEHNTKTYNEDEEKVSPCVCVKQLSWSSLKWEDYFTNGDKLLHTETKTIEVDA